MYTPGLGAFGYPKWQISMSPYIPVMMWGGGLAGSLQPNYARGGKCGFWRPQFPNLHTSPWWGFTVHCLQHKASVAVSSMVCNSADSPGWGGTPQLWIQRGGGTRDVHPPFCPTAKKKKKKKRTVHQLKLVLLACTPRSLD